MITLAIHCVGFYVLRIQWCYNCPIVASSPWQTAGLALAGEGMLTRAGQARKSAGECEFVAKGIAVQPGLHIAGRADAIAGQQAACIDLTREDPCPSDMILMDVPCTPGTQGLLLHCPSWYTIDLQNITGLHRGAAGYGKVPGVETCPQTGWQPAVSLHHEGWEYTQGQLERLQEMVDQSAAPGMRSPTGISLRQEAPLALCLPLPPAKCFVEAWCGRYRPWSGYWGAYRNREKQAKPGFCVLSFARKMLRESVVRQVQAIERVF